MNSFKISFWTHIGSIEISPKLCTLQFGEFLVSQSFSLITWCRGLVPIWNKIDEDIKQSWDIFQIRPFYRKCSELNYSSFMYIRYIYVMLCAISTEFSMNRSYSWHVSPWADDRSMGTLASSSAIATSVDDEAGSGGEDAPSIAGSSSSSVELFKTTRGGEIHQYQ